MTRLNELRDNPGANKKRVRVGRGIGSGVGKTGGRGGKGQTARSGVAINGFEGGQMPLHMRMPKRGFNALNPSRVAEVNVGALEVFAAGAKVDETVLRDKGLVKGRIDAIKILGKGELTKAVVVTAHSFSKGAQEKIAKAGGKAILATASLAAPAAAK